MRNTPPKPRRIRTAHESKSAAVRAAAAAPSRRQQSKWQREQHQLHTLYIAIGVLVAFVLLIFAGGVIYDNVVRANEVVAQIGPESVTAAQLLAEIQPSVRALDSQAKQIGGGTNIAQYVDQQKRSLPDQTLNDMIDEHVIAQEAARRSISIPQSDLDDKERQTVADFQSSTNPVATPEATADASLGTPGAAADTSAAANPDAASTPGAAADAAGATPSALATAAAAATPSPFTTPTAVPTLVDIAYGTALQQLLDRNNLTESEFRDRLQQSMLRDKVLAAVGADQVPDTQDQIHAREILVGTQDQAASVLAQIQGGADFGQLAQASSTDTASKDKGGDLGWVTRAGLDKPLADAAFTLQPGQTTDVVQGAGGFGIVQVLERDPARPVPADQLTSLRQKAGTDWLDTRRTGQDVKLQLTQPDRDWILARIGVRP
jgi:parvulin-like peptidyl-prolyl isomerase